MTSVSGADDSAAVVGLEMLNANMESPSAEGAETAADTPASSGFSSNTSPYTISSRSNKTFPNGTWECRVKKQCSQLRELFHLPDTEVCC